MVSFNQPGPPVYANRARAIRGVANLSHSARRAQHSKALRGICINALFDACDGPRCYCIFGPQWFVPTSRSCQNYDNPQILQCGEIRDLFCSSTCPGILAVPSADESVEGRIKSELRVSRTKCIGPFASHDPINQQAIR